MRFMTQHPRAGKLGLRVPGYVERSAGKVIHGGSATDED